MEFDKSVLILTHSDYVNTDAGVEKVIQGHQELFLNHRMNFIAVYPVRKDIEIMGWVHSHTMPNYGLIVNGDNQGEIQYQQLLELISNTSLQCVIIHELVTFKKNQKLFDLFDHISVPIYYFVHDYAMVCYNHILMRNNREFCGTEPISFKKCKNCRFYLEGKLNEKWQKKFVERYPQIVYLFPSTVVRDVWQNTFHASNTLKIVPNTKFGKAVQEYKEKHTKLRIAFIGYGRVEKGWNTWKKICQKYGEKYDLFILGDGKCDGKVTQQSVSVAKDGPNAMIDAIRANEIDIAFLWSTVPETYSYTFFESYVSGCFVVTNTLSGNICRQTTDYQCGKVFEDEEELFAYLDDYEEVQKSVKEMYLKNGNHPTTLENNDEILSIVRG